jgi:LPS export ABC transporter protein LptC
MGMQRTIRILRVALPIAFVAFVILIAVSWNRSRVQKRNKDAEPITTTRPPSDRPIAASVGFEDTQTIGGRVTFRIKAQRVVAFESRWSTLEGVQITIYRPTGLTYELVCPQAQYNSDTKEAEAKGGVRVTSSDGVEVSTAEIHYDGRRLTNKIPVQFKIDRWQGSGGALDMDVENESVRLLNRVTATMTPAVPTQPPMTLRGTECLFRRRENDVTFTENVEMTRAADRLTADRVAGRFTSDRRSLTALEGNGSVEIVMASNPSPSEDLGGRKRLECDRFFSDVAIDGQISAITAVGDIRPAHAVLDGPPIRDIVARTFRLALANRAVREIRAEPDVVMKELGKTPREVRSQRVNVLFDPLRHRATSAVLDGSVKYHDQRTDAVAVRADYDIINDRILLTAAPGFDPSVTTDGQTVKAKQIEFSPRAGTARATGEVIAELVSKQGGPSADSTNVFPAGKPVFVNADSLVLRQATKVATFNGNVRAWQELNTLFAQELQVQGPSQVITARGEVRTTLYNAGTEPRKVPVLSRSDVLVARRNDRRIELTGSVRIEDESRTVEAEEAKLHFDANRKIERIEAETKVVLVEKPSNRRVTGDKAVYHVARKLAYVDGSPATATDPQGNVTGQQIVFDLARNRVQVLSPTGPTTGTYKQQ